MRAGAQRLVTSATIAAIALLLTACGAGGATGPDHAEPDASLEPAASFRCGAYEVTSETLADPTPASELEGSWFELMRGGQAGLFKEILEHPEDWSVLEEDERKLALFGSMDMAGRGWTVEDRILGYDHELYSIVLRSDDNLAMPLKEGTNWDIDGITGCRLATDPGLPAVSLDPAHPVDEQSDELHLLVIDHDCGGDTDMPERIEVRRLEQRPHEVGLLIGAEPLPPGSYTCQGFPPTPYVLQLDAPIGERAILDLSRPASHWDMRAAIAPPAPLSEAEAEAAAARAAEVALGIRDLAKNEPGFVDVQIDDEYLVHLLMDRGMTEELKLSLTTAFGDEFTVDYAENPES